MLTIGIMISYGVNITLLYNRKKKWNSGPLRYILTLSLFLIGIFYYIPSLKGDISSQRILGWCLMTPFVYNTFEILLKRLSEWKSNRDFILWLRYSSEINDSMFGKNPHVIWLDKVISLTLLLIILIMPILAIF